MKLTELKRKARIFEILCLLIAVAFVVTEAVGLCSGFRVGTPGMVLSNLPQCVIILLILIKAVQLMREIAAKESPFTQRAVRQLRWIGWLLIAIEPVMYLFQAVMNHWFPVRLEDGTTLVIHNFYSGIYVASGLAVLAVAAAFRYGAELQQLSDETL